MNTTGVLFILSGPAGVGKTTVVNSLLQNIPAHQLQRSVTTTTRQPRPEEKNGIHYFFTTQQEFQKKIKNDEFLEYALVHGTTYYGSSKSTVYNSLSKGINIILVIDVQGYLQIIKKDLGFKIVSIFIKPQNIKTLYIRLLNRGTENINEIKNRLKTAEHELSFANKYKYVINSGTREYDLKKILEIYYKETITT